MFRLIQARRQAAKVMQSLAAETPPDPASVATAEELATLRQRMAEALALLKKAKLGGDERRNLYELPWYVIIGPPGSGKTPRWSTPGCISHWPRSSAPGRSAVSAVQRNCDWWFTDEAVLLDTAGRYTTQDSHAQVDKAAWLGFPRPVEDPAFTAAHRRCLYSPSVCRTCCSAPTPSAPPHATAIRARDPGVVYPARRAFPDLPDADQARPGARVHGVFSTP